LNELRRFSRSVRFALQGIVYTVKTQRNMQIHAAATVIVLAASWWLQISRFEVLLILAAIALVWMMELVNTAIEAVVDLASPDWHEKAKAAKDASAAAALVAALLSVLIGIAVLGPPLYRKLAVLAAGLG
jgi:diacylglycerol kinase